MPLSQRVRHSPFGSSIDCYDSSILPVELTCLPAGANDLRDVVVRKCAAGVRKVGKIVQASMETALNWMTTAADQQKRTQFIAAFYLLKMGRPMTE